jgi:hypothetical protein
MGWACQGRYGGAWRRSPGLGRARQGRRGKVWRCAVGMERDGGFSENGPAERIYSI